MGDGAGIYAAVAVAISPLASLVVYANNNDNTLFFVCFFLPPEGRSNNFHVRLEYGFLNRKSSRKRKVGTVVNRKRKERINLFAPFVGDKKKTDSTGQARPDGKSSSSSYYK